MERLTNKCEADAQREEYERRLANGYPRNIPEERFLRLAAYEDTRLMPEEVLPKDKADEIALKLMRLADLESLCNYTRLRELADADKDGRAVVLPCKVGDTVWLSRLLYTPPKEPLPAIVNAIRFDADGIMIVASQRRFTAEAIGETVFYTREEAEKALAERAGKA